MTIKVRQRTYKETGQVTWQADIHVKLLDGRVIRERCKVPTANSRTAAERWAKEREVWLIRYGHDQRDPAPEVKVQKGASDDAKKQPIPTLAEFAPRWYAEHGEANRHRPATLRNKDVLLRNHLIPLLGEVPLDQIGHAHVQKIKAERRNQANGSVNNILKYLNNMLRCAKEWGVLESVPTIKMLKDSRDDFSFWDFEQYAALIKAAGALGPDVLVMLLLGGDAGLRCGEIIALRWIDVDFHAGKLHVRQNSWRGKIGPPKGGKPRSIPLTKALRAALEALRSASGARETVLARVHQGEAKPLTSDAIRCKLRRVCTRAGVDVHGPHTLRHTFCSHLAMKGAPARAIQELAGHAKISTTDLYMHLAPGATEGAIRLLDQPHPGHWYERGTDTNAR